MPSCFTHVQLFATPWSVAHQVPLSMGVSRQEYWSRLPCPSPGDLPNPGTEFKYLKSPALTGKFFTTSATWEAHVNLVLNTKIHLQRNCKKSFSESAPQHCISADSSWAGGFPLQGAVGEAACSWAQISIFNQKTLAQGALRWPVPPLHWNVCKNLQVRRMLSYAGKWMYQFLLSYSSYLS